MASSLPLSLSDGLTEEERRVAQVLTSLSSVEVEEVAAEGASSGSSSGRGSGSALVSCVQAHSAEETQTEAYAKIVSSSAAFFLHSLAASIGRRTDQPHASADIAIGTSKLISRKHATIAYNHNAAVWEIACHGRNGLRVNNLPLARNQPPVPLVSGSLIQIADVPLVFLLPTALMQISHCGNEMDLPEKVAPIYQPIQRTRTRRRMEEFVDLPSGEQLRKPAKSYANLIAEAILSSPIQKMTLADIYRYIMDNYPYYRHAGTGWQNSVRHNLSLNKAFLKLERSGKGKGMFWGLEHKLLDTVVYKPPPPEEELPLQQTSSNPTDAAGSDDEEMSLLPSASTTKANSPNASASSTQRSTPVDIDRFPPIDSTSLNGVYELPTLNTCHDVQGDQNDPFAMNRLFSNAAGC